MNAADHNAHRQRLARGEECPHCSANASHVSPALYGADLACRGSGVLGFMCISCDFRWAAADYEQEQLDGFLFTVTDLAGRQHDLRLQGHGGERGSGCLARANELQGDERTQFIAKVCAALLRRTRAELEATGEVRPVDGEPLALESVDACRGVFAGEG